MEKQEYIEAGRINNTHGVAGEVRDRSLAGFPPIPEKMRQDICGGQGA
ncbi:MAG: hypothetical protein V8T45_04610 [Oscillospiraceae bacterium]